MTDTGKDTIAKKIAKLLAKAKSAETLGSQAEAEAFAAKANELLLRHKIDLTQVELDTIEDTDPMGRTRVEPADLDTRKKRTRIKRGARIAWVQHLADLVARAHFCRIFVITGSSSIIFLGRASDRALAADVFLRLVQFATDAADDAYGAMYRAAGNVSIDRGFKDEFHRGFRMAIKERFDAIKRQMEGEATTTTALIVLHDKAVVEYVAKQSAKTVGGLSTRQGSDAARSAGYAAGQRAQIRREVR